MGHCVKDQLMMKDSTQPGDHWMKDQSMMKDNTQSDPLKLILSQIVLRVDIFIIKTEEKKVYYSYLFIYLFIIF